LKGTWKFDLEDDNGIKQTIKIPNTLYCKEAPYCLLSPQHWSQQSQNTNGTYCKVGHKFMERVWQNSNLHCKVKLNANNNCGIIWSAQDIANIPNSWQCPELEIKLTQ